MLIVLSPAKRLDFESAPHIAAHTQPRFLSQARPLVELLKKMDTRELASLMSISDPLAALNAARFGQWKPPFTTRNARQAVLAFAGDVYEGLDAPSLDESDLGWAQDHVRILSGLYGVLRPLDLIQPYRLEMGTRLHTDAAGDLYGFWGDTLAQYLDRRLRGAAAPVVVNLASQEYARAALRPALKARVVDCVFEDSSGGPYKVVGLFAKRARGMMARFAIERRIDTPQALQRFDRDGYAFDRAASSRDRLVFRRRAG